MNSEIAWLEGVKISYQHMQLNGKICRDRLSKILFGILRSNKLVYDLSYGIDNKCVIVSRALAVNSGDIFELNNEVLISFDNVEPGVFDLHLSAAGSGVNGAPGYLNNSNGNPVSYKEYIDQYDSERQHEILMINKAISLSLTKVIDEEASFEDSVCVPILRVAWNSKKIEVLEELYSSKLSSEFFINRLTNYNCIAAREVVDNIYKNLYTDYYDLFRQLYFQFSSISNLNSTTFDIKHGQSRVLKIVSLICDDERENNNNSVNIKEFAKDENSIWFCDDVRTQGSINCELVVHGDVSLSINDLIIVDSYETIINTFSSGMPGMELTTVRLKRNGERVYINFYPEWDGVRTIAIKALYNVEVSRAWLSY